MPDGEDLRSLMRRFPSGVAVLTVSGPRQPDGITVGSLVSLSLEPPLVGVSVSRQSPVHELLREASAWAFSLLGAEQDDLARHFARSGMPPLVRWSGIRTRVGATGAPLLEDALGWIECRARAELEVGTHTFFAGEAVAIEEGPAAGPLLYLGGTYVAP